MIALCLQTCDRFAMTARTLHTFAQHNDLKRFSLFHGDDASSDSRVCDLVASYGFETVAKTVTRFGMLAVRKAMINVAAERGAEWIFVLENDIETLRPFPWNLFHYVQRDQKVYCLRLYGRFKDAERKQPCLTVHKRDKSHVTWARYEGAPEPAQIGRIHWSAQPAVTRTRELVAHHRNGQESEKFTVRVKKNVVSHMGLERTPGRK